MYRHLALALVITSLVASCSKHIEISKQSMPPPSEGQGPWQIITYNEQRLEREVVKFENGEVYSVAKAVYMNRNGQLVFKDGEPLKTLDNENIYWNDQGLLLSSSGRVIKKSRYFSVNEKPADDHTPLMFRDLLLSARANLESQRSGSR